MNLDEMRKIIIEKSDLDFEVNLEINPEHLGWRWVDYTDPLPPAFWMQDWELEVIDDARDN